jgi:hypothetical protein
VQGEFNLSYFCSFILTRVKSTSRNATTVDDFLDGKFMDIGSDDESDADDEQVRPFPVFLLL